MNDTLKYLIIALLFIFGVISQYRMYFLVIGAGLFAINIYRYIVHVANQKG